MTSVTSLCIKKKFVFYFKDKSQMKKKIYTIYEVNAHEQNVSLLCI